MTDTLIKAGLVSVLTLLSNPAKAQYMYPADTFSFQGHRGARGLVPENTIPSFLKCLELGINAFEFDVVITKDKKVVLSHEAWFNHKITSKPSGEAMTEEEEMKYRLYHLNYDVIKRFDCGKRGHPDFPDQAPLPSYKPLLLDMIVACEAYAVKHKLPPILYNIEVKSYKNGEEGYGIFNPAPDEFADLVYNTIASLNMIDRVVIQSFDPKIVQAIKKINRDVKVSLLVDNLLGFKRNIERLGFMPDVYAPYYKLVTRKLIRNAHRNNIRVITWTVNRPKDMRKLIEKGVDGIISDYPNRFVKLLE